MLKSISVKGGRGNGLVGSVEEGGGAEIDEELDETSGRDTVKRGPRSRGKELFEPAAKWPDVRRGSRLRDTTDCLGRKGDGGKARSRLVHGSIIRCT